MHGNSVQKTQTMVHTGYTRVGFKVDKPDNGVCYNLESPPTCIVQVYS